MSRVQASGFCISKPAVTVCVCVCVCGVCVCVCVCVCVVCVCVQEEEEEQRKDEGDVTRSVTLSVKASEPLKC